MREKIIFLVDDDLDDQFILEMAIHQIDPSVRVYKFNTGVELLRDFEGMEYRIPSLIVLDYNMPCLTGLEVLMKLKGQVCVRNIPKVLWSTDQHLSEEQDCYESGAVKVYEKPCDYAGFTKLAGELLSYV